MSGERRVRILREAAEELEAAALHLEEDQAGLGAELLAAYERKLARQDRVAARPADLRRDCTRDCESVIEGDRP